MTRNDAHSPANLVTEDYEYVLAGDNSPEEGCPGWVMQYGDFGLEVSRHLAATDRLGRSVFQCHHCGARIRYFAILKHVPTGDYIAVGETCLDNRFERSSRDFQAMRKQATLDRQAQRIKSLVAEFVEANPDLAFMADKTHEHTNDFVADVSRKLRNYGELSDRQIEAVRRSVQRDAEYAARKAAEALNPPVIVPVVEGKVTITGEVKSLKVQHSDFGSTLKMLVLDDRGFKVWGTVPSSLSDGINKVWGERLANGSIEDKGIRGYGRRIRFNATVTASNDDPSFGFFKRPTKAEFIDQQEEEVA